MKTVILCGGKGTRLREETEYRPKPLVPVGGKPILWHIMKLYGYYGFSDFICCLGYKGEMVKEYFLNYEAMNNDFMINLGKQDSMQYYGNIQDRHFNVTLAHTGEENMTGSRIKQIEKYLGNDDIFAVTYGDGLANVNIPELLAFHRQHGKMATVTTVNPSSRFALLHFDESGLVSSFDEKPKMHSWISIGFFIFNREVLNYLKTDPSCILENDPLEKLTAEGQLMAYRHEGFFYSMDTYRDFTLLNSLWEQKKAPWAIWDKNRSTSQSSIDVTL